jgi:hypothetical protein
LPSEPAQAVSLDDYEAVKKMWKENYQKLMRRRKDRTTWISKDQKISETINLLSSVIMKEKKGMQRAIFAIPDIGDSKTEVIAYLKAKLKQARVFGRK